ncbi:MAG: hypothetical protein VW877_16755 [Pseudomonadaceae bacterium]
MTWTVKAIDKKIMLEGSIIIVSTMIMIMFGLWVGMGYWVLGAVIPMIFIFHKQAMQKTVFVYRATDKHLEVCRWQDIPDMVFIFLRVLPFLMIGIVLMLLVSNPALSIVALAGPALVGIGLASVGGDSSYQTYWQDFQHNEYLWSDVLEAMLDTKQGLIRITLPYELPAEYAAQVENPEQFNRQDVRLYFREDQQEDVIEMVRRQIPGVALTPGRQLYEW